MEDHSALKSEDVAGKDLFALFADLRGRNLVAPFERALKGESSVLSTALHHYLLLLPSPLREPGFSQMLQTVRIAPLRSSGVICGIVVVIEDVSQRESQAATLNRRHRRDEVLSWALAHFLKSEEPRKSIRQLFFKIAEHLDFDTFFLYLRDIETGVLSLNTFGGIPVDLEGRFADYPLFSRAAELRETVVFDSVRDRSEADYDLLKQAGISAAVAMPLVFNDRSLGLLCFATWSREAIAIDELDLLTTISQYLATAIDRENTKLQLQKAKEELSRHAQLLEQKVEERTARLQETISELEMFSYTLAHDLKAPVRGMIGYCNVLLEDYGRVLTPEIILIVQKLARAPRRMEALIKDLLQFSEVSRREIVLSRVEIEPVIDDLLALRAPSVREATAVHSPLHAVRAHRALLQQVLSNLVDNAVKFVEPDASPKITISTEVVSQNSPSTRSRPLLFNSTETATQPSGAAPEGTIPPDVRIWVRDEGIGIPPEAHQKIFGIFERGVTVGAYDGNGMGLAIVARAIQRMGGTCGVESGPGKGSRFWIELPSA